jgi:hypothetical protein
MALGFVVAQANDLDLNLKRSLAALRLRRAVRRSNSFATLNEPAHSNPLPHGLGLIRPGYVALFDRPLLAGGLDQSALEDAGFQAMRLDEVAAPWRP